ncbi:DNA-directed RNA polymerase subunit beta [Candidatus Methylacidiphilum fumarolicum]|uniref:DNA-directed RNA polymerase subunit beta n=2 Tax=Candidatus Methylacidiphilum fumarolicum TaxID=591154 RepID=I0JX22_METFB|nr:DNA-directed RNA polymerase subunit beta [Candidatus Methylacidiphilum fumarolicum]MBW6414482.1 DNA-directed RNA polymerase subunit beta [Candidatus Methylacidiphilum fumarolicum]TFE69480.1 DNA-directed RNA polymerase subunit beta [Candidatus Methylacidiphilum fumarolicum]TFE77124.1 DNA-directed RNA polymerase subunit beta [Candidatus Methylacidiphilum fumarolicum]CAI9085402.1 RNA polymerase subunit beta [Candidatus Methylacidiphilum fumarolicum]CCG91791.1 DNA-directed RNA polymerase beta c
MNQKMQRINFGKIREGLSLPNLIEHQTKSYADFLQLSVAPQDRKPEGLHGVFQEVFPIESYDGKVRLEYVNYEIGDPKFSPIDCLRDGKTYAAPLHVTFRLKDEEGVKEEKVYMGELPMMTPQGSFIINGAERVIVNQLHRSPGICFESSFHSNGKTLYSFRIIPDRGSWLEVAFDSNDLLYVYLDRRKKRRKFLITTLLRALAAALSGSSSPLGTGGDEEIIRLFYTVEEINLSEGIEEEKVATKVLVNEVRDPNNPEVVLARAYEPVTRSVVRQLLDLGIKTIQVVDVQYDDTLIKCIKKDPTKDPIEALKEIYRRLRPGDPPTESNAKLLLKRLLLDPKRYDLGRVGRYKLNQKLNIQVDPEIRILTWEDLVAATRYLIKLKKGEGITDDIDHLGSRRVRAVGELVANQCRMGLARTERLVKERMTLFDVNTEGMTPQKLINPKALSATIRDFFARSQLSQLMDQINPLSELTHKRRLSALGPGGLSRERAGFEVRDVHPSHYGRICPIETPEGPNIGLIATMASYSRFNEYGILETPYRKVVNGKVTNEIVYFTADQEENYVIAMANTAVSDDGTILDQRVAVRFRREFMEVEREKVEYIDVSPKQIVSIAAGLIPFLEHDDANRALMGSNMQRQAVPLIQPEAPIVGTGIEERVARDIQAVVVSETDGVVASVTGNEIIVTPTGSIADLKKKKIKQGSEKEVGIYKLNKFMRSNAGTCINQKPIVKKGQVVKKGDILADGPSTQNGELALGRNLLVAFMPWNGYNFEDAIIVSERIVKEDLFTSIYIDEFEIVARDTKLGPEEITRDIPNVGDEALKNLGPDGIIRVGAEVKPGDILVGKITPKSETELAPEERLLRAIFGEKAADVKDSSLRVPSGTYGIVMDVRVSSGTARVRKEKINASEAKQKIKEIEERYDKKEEELREELTQALSNILLNEKIPLDVVNVETGEIIIPANRKITKVLLRKMAQAYDKIEIDPSPIRSKIFDIIGNFEAKFEQLRNDRELELDQIESGEDTEPGIIKQVKVFIANKRKLSVGDKMAGRHGNKGVVSKIVPVEDMPYLPDGTPVDIVLNPLGVPSRMNVGQVLETHLGIAAKKLGFNVATPVFDGVKEEKIREFLVKAGMDEDGKSILYDGRTGERFNQRVVVGVIYMMKLNHMVADKIHARAVGPYSLVTQQPLGGKAQYGGQRFGEMEVWAMEAYGAAYVLQELLTVKSDDVQGRTRIYESIVKGENYLETTTPESFNVLVKEMQGLCLEVTIGQRSDSFGLHMKPTSSKALNGGEAA